MVILFIARCDHPKIMNSVLEKFGARQLDANHFFKDFIAVTIFSTNKDGVLAFTVAVLQPYLLQKLLLSYCLGVNILGGHLYRSNIVMAPILIPGVLQHHQ